MQLTGLKYGVKLLDLVEFPGVRFLNADVTNKEIQQMLDRSGKLVVKPVFYGGVGKKGKAGLVKIVSTLQDALRAKQELYFAPHQHGSKTVHANGVTFEEFVESDIEVYFSITVSTRERKPIFTITPFGGVDIESLPPEKKHTVIIDPFIGIKSFDITNALIATGCPEQYISPLVQNLPRLWDLYDNFGLKTIELNPIRMMKKGNRYIPVACDIRAEFDQDSSAWRRVALPPDIFQAQNTLFESDINQLRTHQGQSDVMELNPKGTIIPFMFGGGANSAATETLGNTAIFSSDFGGNPPYDKMYSISRIVFRHWYERANVMLIIGGKANNTDIYITFRGVFDALRDHIVQNGSRPLYTIIGRGGPNLIKGMFYARDILDRLRQPYKMFGHDTSLIKVLEYVKNVDAWWSGSGKTEYLKQLSSS